MNTYAGGQQRSTLNERAADDAGRFVPHYDASENLGDLLDGGTIAAKLKVGYPDDPLEREADRVADQVMRMPDSQIQLQPEKKEELIQPKSTTGHGQTVSPALAATIHSMKGGGQPLPQSTRDFFEPRFGADFSQVRIHADYRATQATKSLNARAFTLGQHIAFRAGEYSLETESGKKLLAHELTHVVQGQRNVISLSWDDPDGPERVQFRELERVLREHGFDLGFVEEGDYFRVRVPPGIAPHLGIHDLIPSPQRIHRSQILFTMNEWLSVAIRVEQRSALDGAVRGPNIVDILDAAFARRGSHSRREPLWVMGANDTYTSRVRLWGPVTRQLRVVKQHLEENCAEWMSRHRTSPRWRPNMILPPLGADPHAWDDPSQANPEGGSWGNSPAGTGARLNSRLYGEYLRFRRVPDQLWTSAIGSFGLYVTVDSINCENGSALLNVWMYNDMDQESFGNPESWFSAAGAAMLWSGGVDAQYMWWNWNEPHYWAPRAPVTRSR